MDISLCLIPECKYLFIFTVSHSSIIVLTKDLKGVHPHFVFLSGVLLSGGCCVKWLLSARGDVTGTAVLDLATPPPFCCRYVNSLVHSSVI